MAIDVKKAALSIGEDAVKAVIKDVLRPYAEEKIKDSENKYDDLLLMFLDQLEAELLKLADKVDGEEG